MEEKNIPEDATIPAGELSASPVENVAEVTELPSDGITDTPTDGIDLAEVRGDGESADTGEVSGETETSPLPPPEERSILKHKIYLYLTEFFTGVSVMAVELGASRLLAPYFSSSQIVWTIIIGTIMIALALGNIWGGRNADKDPNPDKLYWRIIIAGLWIAAIPFVGKYIVAGIAAVLVVTISENFLIIAAFLSCIVLFVFPLFLLGSATPCLVKYTVKSLNENGKTVGMMEAFNTIGSILGTFLPTFITIPAVGTSITFLIFAAVLLILALVYFISKGVYRARMIASGVAFVVLCAIGANTAVSFEFALGGKKLVYEGESIYNYLMVTEDDDAVYLSTNVLIGVQSLTMKDGGLSGGYYYDVAMAAPVMAGLNTESEGDVLILGMGTGTYATQLRSYFPNLRVEGVEIDQKITDLAEKYFSLPEDVPVTTYDGRAYLNALDKDRKYDVIMVDAYHDITIPFQMSSVEFFSLVEEHLTPNGIMVVNLNMRAENKDKENDINAYLSDTIASVFRGGDIYQANTGMNRELFVSKTPIDLEAYRDIYMSIPDTRADLRRQLRRVDEQLTKYTPGDRILTDDKAPIELLGMSMIDTLINDEIRVYRDAFREGGLKGVFDLLK